MGLRIIAWLLTAGAAFLMAALGFAAEDIIPGERGARRLGAIAYIVVLGLVPLGMLFASSRLLRAANRARKHGLSWVPVDDQWLPPEMWRELPDPLPDRPRRSKRPPLPTGSVPPDEVQRKLGVIDAEVAYDQRRPVFGAQTPTGWLGMVLIVPLTVVFIAAMAVTVGNFGQRDDFAGGLLLCEWSGSLAVVCVLAFVRPLRRHVGLVRLQQQLRRPAERAT